VSKDPTAAVENTFVTSKALPTADPRQQYTLGKVLGFVLSLPFHGNTRLSGIPQGLAPDSRMAGLGGGSTMVSPLAARLGHKTPLAHISPARTTNR
jgi:hypothetical protein